MMRVILKVYKKGIIVLPKRLREVLGIDEGDMIVAEVMGDKLVMRALKPRVVKLFNEALTNNIKSYISVITLSEILYVASRIYQVAGISDPNSEARNFVEWIKGRTQIISVNEDIAFRAGELKKKLHIVLSDCYVIASAEAIGAIPVFKKIEKK
jgi:AbrB family looped-hinge helix DNA binding protein